MSGLPEPLITISTEYLRGQDILNGILTGQIARRPVLAGGRSLIGILARVEPQKKNRTMPI